MKQNNHVEVREIVQALKKVRRPPITIFTTNTLKTGHEDSITELTNLDTTPEQFSKPKRKWNHANIELLDNVNPTRITRSKAKLKHKKSKRLQKPKVYEI